MLSLSLVVPVYNEQGNIGPLMEAMKAVPFDGELVLVNNGSTDNTAEEIERATRGYHWAKTVTLPVNFGYGGGIQKGLAAASLGSSHLGWMPADLQYSADDVRAVWARVADRPDALHKGCRSSRDFRSSAYSYLARTILGAPRTDINGLPKIFPRRLWDSIRVPLSASFVLDAEILTAAKTIGMPIVEHDVTFHPRNAGVSSWSSKRLRTYVQTLAELVQARKLFSE